MWFSNGLHPVDVPSVDEAELATYAEAILSTIQAIFADQPNQYGFQWIYEVGPKEKKSSVACMLSLLLREAGGVFEGRNGVS